MLMKNSCSLLLMGFIGWFGFTSLSAGDSIEGGSSADWPMWRHDAERSAASQADIASTPELLWSRKLPPVRQAWPLEVYQRLNFDSSYEPVVMGKLLFLASPNDGSITAYDTNSGEEKWKFYTEGPVRCAPACEKGKIYAGSDDGYLYCLDSETGKLLWKFRGAPSERPDYRQIGNGHIVSFWPVRSGPVIKDGTVYFGAGIWPTFGVFLYALDAKTGSVKWKNNELNYITRVRSDHDDRVEDSGLSPQGYLVAIGDKLIVPCGRAMPAGLELATGKLIYYTQGYRRGDSRVAVQGNNAFVGRNAIVNLYDFREIASSWAGHGDKKPAGYKNNALDTPMDLFESPYLPYKYCEGCEVPFVGNPCPPFTGCDAYSAYADKVAYSLDNGTFYAHDLATAKLDRKETTFGGKFNILIWTIKQLWQYKSPYKGQTGGIVIKAGKRVYGQAGKKLLALENIMTAGGTPTVAWEKELNGKVTSLAAADGKLFVAMDNGWIYCFGDHRE